MKILRINVLFHILDKLYANKQTATSDSVYDTQSIEIHILILYCLLYVPFMKVKVYVFYCCKNCEDVIFASYSMNV